MRKSSQPLQRVKPTARDDFVEQSDEPETFQLKDCSDPDAVIAAICLGGYDACNVDDNA